MHAKACAYVCGCCSVYTEVAVCWQDSNGLVVLGDLQVAKRESGVAQTA